MGKVSAIEWTDKKLVRFWNKVDRRVNAPCWEWLGSKGLKGYGEVRIDKQLWRAHRAVWILYFGSIPEGLLICHHCDNPSCVNPEHLFMGTALDNTRDMYEKGREFIPTYTEVGEKHCQSKLTDDAVREIRTTYPKLTMQALADYFNVSLVTVWQVIHRKTWRHI